MKDPPLQSLLEFAVDLAWKAGRLTLAYFQTRVASETKPDNSPVTAADRETERFLREEIRRRFPDDGIVGEEFGVDGPDARRRWILDPIDGTRSFIRGVPLYGVLIAAETDEETELGVLYFPALDEIVYAARGLGCWWNGRRARVSEVGSLEDSGVLLTDGQWPGADGWEELRSRAGCVRTWGDCYGHALVATGRAEVMVDPVMSVWDSAALRPVIEEAGGVFTDWGGKATHRGGSAVSTNRALADEVRQLLAV